MRSFATRKPPCGKSIYLTRREWTSALVDRHSRIYVADTIKVGWEGLAARASASSASQRHRAATSRIISEFPRLSDDSARRSHLSALSRHFFGDKATLIAPLLSRQRSSPTAQPGKRVISLRRLP